MEKFNKIAIIGGSGKAGKYLIQQLIHQGFSIKVLLRNPEKLSVHSPLIEIVQGNAEDYNSVAALLEGCGALISTLGTSKGEKPIHSVATLHIIKAMNLLTINRYIVVTGLSISTPSDKKSFKTRMLSGMMKLLFREIISDKQKAYSILSESNLNWTLVRLPLIELTEETRGIKSGLTDCPGDKISASDLAVFLTEQLNDNTFIKKAPFIAS